MLVKNSVRLIAISIFISCAGTAQQGKVKEQSETTVVQQEPELRTGAERMGLYLSQMEGKRVAVVANQTSMVDNVHLVDTLLARGVEISHAYAPEHGFRGNQDAGAHISDEKDMKTGLSIYSLHGSSKKPSAESLEGVDILLFDIQDVGARFYTYISSLHYVMEACAEQGVKVIVLDRPNPHGHYIDGPVMEEEFSSFVGMHPVPVVYGMTIGEYAQMINGEHWMKAGVQAELQVIPIAGYTHVSEYRLPIPPSPNLPNQASIELYPSLCFFEGTVVSIGRGTDHPFQIVGHPDFGLGSYMFTPESNYGSKYPKLKGETCNGQFLGEEAGKALRKEGQLNLSYLIGYYEVLSQKGEFFNNDGFFEKLSGTAEFRKQIESGMNEEEIRVSWKDDLEAFAKVREKYLIYPD